LIDLLSDTVTRPSPGMREAMASAEVGDDCFGEDPTVRRLEERVAGLLEKERALFFPSGTMANQCALLAQTHPGQEVLVEAGAHLLHYEEGSLAVHGGLLLRQIPAGAGILTVEEVTRALRPPSSFHPVTSVLALENSHLDSGGRAMSPGRTEELARTAREAGLLVHLDGARLWNAAAALEVAPHELTESVDTVMTCLSKGLGAPVGSLFSGPAEVVERGWRIRRRLGGQMRQAGILAAAGLYALEHNLPRVQEDHRRARMLAEGLSRLPGVSVPMPETNVVMVGVDRAGPEVGAILEGLKRRGVRMGPFGPRRIRAVLHLDVDDAGVETSIEAFADVLQSPDIA
jgi:threonine aldolase